MVKAAVQEDDPLVISRSVPFAAVALSAHVRSFTASSTPFRMTTGAGAGLRTPILYITAAAVPASVFRKLSSACRGRRDLSTARADSLRSPSCFAQDDRGSRCSLGTSGTCALPDFPQDNTGAEAPSRPHTPNAAFEGLLFHGGGNPFGGTIRWRSAARSPFCDGCAFCARAVPHGVFDAVQDDNGGWSRFEYADSIYNSSGCPSFRGFRRLFSA